MKKQQVFLLLSILIIILISCTEEKPKMSYLEACIKPEALKDIRYYVKNKVANGAGLMLASCTNTNEKIIKELLKSKIISEKDELQALWNSLDNPNPAVCDVLVKATKGANSNLSDTHKTILMEACKKGNVAIVEVLLKNGAKVDIKDKRGNTALGYAYEKPSAELLKVLRDAGAFKIPKYEMVPIPGKNFEMLSTEVTQELYTSFRLNPSNFIGDRLPVENVSWYDAIIFCNILSINSNLTPVYDTYDNKIITNDSADGFRLPTVEEWDYAAKGGGILTSFYAGSTNIDEVAWYKNNSFNRTQPVAQKRPNEYGLYDMSGNVWEWCWDTDPYSDNNRYIRGGSIINEASYCTVSGRLWDGVENRKRFYSNGQGWFAFEGRFWDGANIEHKHSTIGFRIVRNIQ